LERKYIQVDHEGKDEEFWRTVRRNSKHIPLPQDFFEKVDLFNF